MRNLLIARRAYYPRGPARNTWGSEERRQRERPGQSGPRPGALHALRRLRAAVPRRRADGARNVPCHRRGEMHRLRVVRSRVPDGRFKVGRRMAQGARRKGRRSKEQGARSEGRPALQCGERPLARRRSPGLHESRPGKGRGEIRERRTASERSSLRRGRPKVVRAEGPPNQSGGFAQGARSEGARFRAQGARDAPGFGNLAAPTVMARFTRGRPKVVRISPGSVRLGSVGAPDFSPGGLGKDANSTRDRSMVFWGAPSSLYDREEDCGP